VLIADDNGLFVRALEGLFESEEWIRVIARAENGKTAAHLAPELRPDVVLMDLSMPHLDGSRRPPGSSRKLLKRRSSSSRAPMIPPTSSGPERQAAADYVTKDPILAELAAAIRSAARRG
jgi:DNA-binding NarL/FixJ family response regulator